MRGPANSQFIQNPSFIAMYANDGFVPFVAISSGAFGR
jgi:hypothetical protein